MSSQRPWVAHYQKGVPETVDIPEMPLHRILTDSARKYPNHVAARLVLKYLPLGLVIQSKLTYRELDEASDRFATALQALGVRQGDRVTLMLPNVPQTVVAYFGILKAGAIVVNTNPTYTPRELEYQLTDSSSETIITLSGLYDRYAQISGSTKVRNVILLDIPDMLTWPFKSLVEKSVRASGMMTDVAPAANIHWLPDLLRRHPARPTPVTIQADDVAIFQYSGGTTGVPKAAMLTHRNLVANTVQMAAWFVNMEYGKEKMLCALPMFHVYGMTVGMLLGIYSGAELVIIPDPRQTNHVLDVIQNEKISLYPGVPSMYIGIINHPKVQEYNLQSIKACLSGGSALPVEVAQKFEEITGGRLVEGFGMTESSPVTHANPLDGRARVGSIGLVISSTDARIVGLEPDENGAFQPVDAGQEGELCVRGPQVMKGYWNRDDETAKTIIDGWLHTGDIARMDEDGYFYIVDRKKDLIIAGGYNVVPREIEEVLFMHPKVLEAAVAGIPHPRRGETVKAYVVLKSGEQCSEDEIFEFCKQNLAPYKVPKMVEFRDSLPKTQVGKVLRRLLVEEEKARFAKEPVA